MNSIFQKVAKVSQCEIITFLTTVMNVVFGFEWFGLVLCYSDLMNDVTLMLAE